MKILHSSVSSFQIHPLGFYYLVLSTEASTERVHVYGKEDFRAENSWHTHEFDLHSTVLAGSIDNEIAEFMPALTGDLEEFKVSYSGKNSKISPTGRIGAMQTTILFTTGVGQSYFIRTGQIHRATCKNLPCVTHVRFEHRQGSIYSYGQQESPFLRRTVSEAEASEIADILHSHGLISGHQA